MELLAGIFVGMIAHEWGHIIVAERVGDWTPRSMGRWKLNPFVHLDPLWSILLPATTWWLTGIPLGSAKPVPLTPELLWRRRDRIALLAAGPAANLVVALAFWLVGLHAAALVNVALAAFNMLPIPPLDGWHIAADLLRKPRRH